MSDDITRIAREIASADHVVALTGAGVSTASGIPDFRSEGGIWDQYDPSEFHYSRFKADPGTFWEKRIEMYESVFGDDVGPNEAHKTLASLESAGLLDIVITQNIDGLHHEAGSNSVLEIHGNGKRVACEGCGQTVPLDPVVKRVENGERPPRCESCSDVLKPDVVLFGEPLPQGAMQQAQRHARQADVFLAVGSSLSVQPAASLPQVAQRHGATLVTINLEPTGLSATTDFKVLADVTEALPAIAAELD